MAFTSERIDFSGDNWMFTCKTCGYRHLKNGHLPPDHCNYCATPKCDTPSTTTDVQAGSGELPAECGQSGGDAVRGATEMQGDVKFKPTHPYVDTRGGSTPHQYGLPDGAGELQDLIEYRDMNFAIGNIFKACYRQGTCSHSDELRDINKIIWFAEREKNRLERENKKD